MGTTLDEILNLPVSYFKHFSGPPSFTITVGRALNGIKGNYYKEIINKLRQNLLSGNIRDANKIKLSLPSITFSATFNDRRVSSLCKSYNSLLVIDIDKLDTNEMIRINEILMNDNYVFSFWKSPSGNGYKGLIALSSDLVNLTDANICSFHSQGFNCLEKYFKEKYNVELDKSGKDITRLCFFSYCPELFLKNEVTKFEFNYNGVAVLKDKKNRKDLNKKESSTASSVVNTLDINRNIKIYRYHQYYRSELKKIIKYLTHTHTSITKTYADWTKVAFAISASIHPDVGCKLFLELCRLDKENYDENKSLKLIHDAYREGSVNCDFSTIIYLAKKEGYIYTLKVD